MKNERDHTTLTGIHSLRGSTPEQKKCGSVGHRSLKIRGEVLGCVVIGGVGKTAQFEEGEVVEASGTRTTGSLPCHCTCLGCFAESSATLHLDYILVSTGNNSEVHTERERIKWQPAQRFDQTLVTRKAGKRMGTESLGVVVLHRLRCHHEIADSKLGRERSRRTDADHSLNIRSVIEEMLRLHAELRLAVSATREHEIERWELLRLDSTKLHRHRPVPSLPQTLGKRRDLAPQRRNKEDHGGRD